MLRKNELNSPHQVSLFCMERDASNWRPTLYKSVVSGFLRRKKNENPH
jgi:hypothetical protein